MRITHWRSLCAFLIAAAALLCESGCSYLQNRGADMLDCMDLGVSLTPRPTFALYYRLPVVPVAGALGGKVDGYVAGIGGGNAGYMRHYERNYGLFLREAADGDPDAFWRRVPIPLILSGVEEVAFGDFDKHNPEHVRRQRMGLIGMFQGPFPGPDYFSACPHYIHFGWIGVVATPRYNEWLDFILGLATLDISGDDGLPRGYWPGQDRSEYALQPGSLSRSYIGRSRWALVREAAPQPELEGE